MRNVLLGEGGKEGLEKMLVCADFSNVDICILGGGREREKKSKI